MTQPIVHVHAVESRSRANGPGVRFVLWFQGCTLACPGCFNPATHDQPPQRTAEVNELIAEIRAQGGAIEGVTFSGGEPLQQPEAVLALARAIREHTELSILVFSGYSRREIERLPLGSEILQTIDVLVDGRYVDKRRLGRGLRGSENQRVHLLSARYRAEDIEQTPTAEVRIDAEGRVVLTGVDPLDLS